MSHDHGCRSCGQKEHHREDTTNMDQIRTFVERIAVDGFGIPLPQGCSKWGTGEWMAHLNGIKTELMHQAKKVLGK